MGIKEYRIIGINKYSLDEWFLEIPLLDEAQADAICLIINKAAFQDDKCIIYWEKVNKDYTLNNSFPLSII